MRRLIGCLCLLPAFLIFVVSQAYAYHYAVTYKGGVCQFSPVGYAPFSVPYAGSTTYGGGGMCFAYPEVPPNQVGPFCPGAVACSGAVTATLTWTADAGDQPGQAAPTQVVVLIQSSAAFTGATGNCEDGLAPNPGSLGQVTDTKYDVITSNTAVITETFTPNALGSDNASNPSASVSVKLSAIVPTMTVTGLMIKQDKKPYIIIGQQLGASLNLAGLPFNPGSGNTTNIVGGGHDVIIWEVKTGHPFTNYSPNQGAGILIPYGPPNATSTKMYFAGDTSKAESCTIQATVQLAVLGAQTLTFSQPFTVETPASAMPTLIGTSQLYGTNTKMGLYGLPGGNGITFGGNVTDPSGYTGSGIWCYAQLVTPNREIDYTSNGLPYKFPHTQYSGQGLDNNYPYPFNGGGPNSANGTTVQSQDLPYVSLIKFTTEYKATASDALKMYIMYQPPGSAVCYVPLCYIDYTWGGVATLGDSGWVLSGNYQTVNMSASLTFVHPTWTTYYSNDTLGGG